LTKENIELHSGKIAFIGAGNMAQAIIGGLLAQGYPQENISAAGPGTETLEKVTKQFAIAASTDNNLTAACADVIVLAVKPQVMKEVATALKKSLSHNPLIISLAAGISTQSLANWLGEEKSIVRCMPNTPAQLRFGASGLFANANVSSEQKQLADTILSAVGIAEWVVQEEQLNTVTAVSGSGPAYFFLFMESMIAAAVKQGLSRELATKLTLQTALGAAHLAQQSHLDLVELRRKVTSPKGTTEQAILSFEQDKIREIVEHAMQACNHRAQELSKNFI
jgi:pyrroline-5-carboxylate reductase